MPTVDIHLPHHRYTVHIGSGILARLGDLTRGVAPHHRAAVLSDGNVEATHAARAAAALAAAGYQTVRAQLPPGEEHKTLDTVRSLYEVLLGARLERRSPVVAVGGGVTGDTAGFVAATYLRGVPLIQCPTTLLAMVDSSVGGKVGVDVPQGKNLIGAFYQPSLVVIDTDTLATLPARELRCGLAECIKHAVIRDAALLTWTSAHLPQILALDPPTLVELIERNVQIKAWVVMHDEKEAGERAHLNFGHTFGHAIESTTGYSRYHHGEGVALGMVAATRLAIVAGLCKPDLLATLVDLLRRTGLPVSAPGDALPATATLMEAMTLDKKVAGGRIRFILPQGPGQVTIVDNIAPELVRQAWDFLRQPPALDS